MNRAQIIVMGVAIAAGGGAFLIRDDPVPVALPVPSMQASMDHVLVAARDLSYGVELAEGDVKWVDWPRDAVPAEAILKSADSVAPQNLKGSYVRAPMSAGEPVRRARLVKGVAAGVMATMLTPGKRAVAIDVSLNNTAGGFILPNDHVDVLRTYRDPVASKEFDHEVLGLEQVLSNVRVLAMGQTVERKGGEPVVTGSTATLELDPQQAEAIVLAQRTGQLTLILRPITDVTTTAEVERSEENDSLGLTVVRRGISTTMRAK